MRILLLNESDLEGGAARAAYRLQLALRKAGADCRMLVQNKLSDDPDVLGPSKGGPILGLARSKLESLRLRTFNKVGKHQAFSAAWLPDTAHKRALAAGADLYHLHWINHGFLRLESLGRLDKPVIWTMHDMWAFTGGCHYDGGCGRYADECGRCPQLGSSRPGDLSRQVHRRKHRAWRGFSPILVCPSRWMAGRARSSSLFRNSRIEVIPNGLDLERYRPRDKSMARSILGLPQDKDIVLFGAMSTGDKRKGFAHLKAALDCFSALPGSRNVQMVVFGAGRPPAGAELSLPATYLGRLHDDASLSLLFSAADVFVSPSTEDNLPNTVMESMACGTPCLSFRIGGMEDMIDHGRNGILAPPFDEKDLAEGLSSLLSKRETLTAFSAAARGKAEAEWGMEHFARAHLALYADVLAGKA